MFAGGINPATTLRPGSNWPVEHAFCKAGFIDRLARRKRIEPLEWETR